MGWLPVISARDPDSRDRGGAGCYQETNADGEEAYLSSSSDFVMV